MVDTRKYSDRREYMLAWRKAKRAEIRGYENRQYAARPDYREYRQRYQAERYAERRTFIDEWKLAHGCTDCGYAEHACALDLDHRDPATKLKTVAEIMHASWAKLLAEVEKCDVRCRNCHAVRTQTQKLGGRPRTKGVTLDGA